MDCCFIPDDKIKKRIYNFVKILHKTKFKVDRSHYLFECKCLKCGERFQSPISAIKLGRTKSCGCMRRNEKKRSNFKNYTGKTVGFLKILKDTGKTDENGLVIWDAVCYYENCGNKVEVSSDLLRRERKISCNCYNRKQTRRRALKTYEVLDEC